MPTPSAPDVHQTAAPAVPDPFAPHSASEGLTRTACPLDEIPTLPALVLSEARADIERRLRRYGDVNRTQRGRWLWDEESAVHRLALFMLIGTVFNGVNPAEVARREGTTDTQPRALQRLCWVYGAMPGDDPLAEFALVLWGHLSGVVGLELMLFIPIDPDGPALLALARAAWEARGAAKVEPVAAAPSTEAPRFTLVPGGYPCGYRLAIDGEAREGSTDFIGGGVRTLSVAPTELEPHHWLRCALDRLNRPESGLVMEIRRVPPEAGPLADVLDRTVWIQGRPFVFPAAATMGRFLALLVSEARLPSAPALSASGSRLVVRGADKAGRFLLCEDAQGVYHLRQSAAPDEPFIRLAAQNMKPTFQTWGSLIGVINGIDEDFGVTVRLPRTAEGYPAHVEVSAQSGGDTIMFELDTQQGGVTLGLLLKALGGSLTVEDLAAFPVRAERVVSLGGVAIVTIWPEWFETPEGAGHTPAGADALRWLQQNARNERLGVWARPRLGGRYG